jgi:DNA polymerase-3 subunit gamma/tau
MNTISWAEKHLPKSMSDVVFNDPNTEHFMLAYEGGQMRCPHLLLYGTNGNGKTTVANLIAKALSDDGGLLLSNTIEDFLRRSDLDQYVYNTVFAFGRTHNRAIIIFNELEQFSRNLGRLWTTMDKLEDKLLVIITTNEPQKLPDAIKSRCDKFAFKRITPEQFAPRAQRILLEEGLSLSVGEVASYLRTYSGAHSDVRDYLRTMDKMLSLHRSHMLPAISVGASKPLLTVVS